MTDNTPATPADIRRAAALIVHFGTNNNAGINAVLDETREADRTGVYGDAPSGDES